MGSARFSDSGGLLDGFYYGGRASGGGHGDDLRRHHHQLGASTSSALSAEERLALTGTRRSKAGDKAAMALKSHSEAERRRRERINAHLDTLRSMVPCTDKMDKAALLAEVITHVKALKADAARIGRQCAVPAGADEVAVELVQQEAATQGGGTAGVLVKATLSCDDGADVFADVKHALRPLGLRAVGSEVTALGGRVRFTFLFLAAAAADDARGVVESLRHALQSVLDKADPALEFAPRASLLNKRRRGSPCSTTPPRLSFFPSDHD